MVDGDACETCTVLVRENRTFFISPGIASMVGVCVMDVAAEEVE